MYIWFWILDRHFLSSTRWYQDSLASGLGIWLWSQRLGVQFPPPGASLTRTGLHDPEGPFQLCSSKMMMMINTTLKKLVKDIWMSCTPCLLRDIMTP